jgi:hypothetical protein
MSFERGPELEVYHGTDSNDFQVSATRLGHSSLDGHSDRDVLRLPGGKVLLEAFKNGFEEGKPSDDRG